MAASYLLRSRHGTVWYFRRRIPDGLRAALGKLHLYRSLGTANYRVAVTRARALAVQTDRLFARLLQMTEKKIPPEQIKEEFDKDWGSWGDELPPNLPPYRPPGEAPVAPPPAPAWPPSPQQPSHQARSAPADGEADPVGPRIGYEFEMRRDAFGNPMPWGKADPNVPGDHENLMEAIKVMLSSLPPSATTPAATTSSTGDTSKLNLTVAEGVEFWFEHSVRQLSQSTQRSYQYTVDNLIFRFFDPQERVADIDQGRFADFTYWVHEKFSTRSPDTRNGYITHARTMFGVLFEHGRTKQGIAAGRLQAKVEKTADQKRDSFTLDQVRTIFEHVVPDRRSQPEHFWSVIASAFFGCRLSELCQLNLSTDLKHDGQRDIWYLSINEDRDTDGVLRKELKTGPSRRTIAIHPALIKHGFVEFLKKRRATGANTRPFSARWKPTYDKAQGDRALPDWGAQVSNWGSRQLKKLVAKHGWKAEGESYGFYHSFRHTLTTRLYGKVELLYSSAYMGHEFKEGNTNSETYTKAQERWDVQAEQIHPALFEFVDILDDVIAREADIAAANPRKRRGRPKKAR